MELKDFIENTLSDIALGVEGANTRIKKARNIDKAVFEMEPFERDNQKGFVSFDIAVTVLEEKKGDGGGKLKVASMIEVGGSGSKRTQNEAISRIQFHVLPIVRIN